MADTGLKTEPGDFFCFSDYNTNQINMFERLDISIYPEGIYIWEADLINREITYADIADKKSIFTFEEFLNTLDKSDKKKVKEIISDSTCNKNKSIDIDVRIETNACIRWYKVKGSVFYFSENKVLAIGVAFDIDGTKEQLGRIEYFRTHDYLTGLSSMISFDKYQNSQNFTFPQALIVADIDNLKEINDTLGYRAGNTLIKSVAEALKEFFFDAEIIMRAGGGEFCAVFSGKDALEIDMKIKEAGMLIHRMYLNLIKTEVSFGYAVSNNDCDLFNLYGQAVRRMRRNKNIKKFLTKYTVVDKLNEIINRKAGWGRRHVRIQSLSMEIAQELGCNEEIKNVIKVLSKIAGLGYAGIDDRLLKNRNSLSGRDVIDFMKHVEIGRAIIAGIEELEEMEELYLDVFKRYDEWKEGISLSSRILAGAAGFDDIAFSNNNKRLDEIISELKKQRGIKYCPTVIDAVISVVGKQKISQGEAT